MRAALIVALIVGLHVVVIGTVSFLQGCETPRPAPVEPPPAPVMPPRAEIMTPAPKPVLVPPPAVQAPAAREHLGGKTYVVKSGDMLSKIAARSGVTSREIMELNGIKDPNKIRIGQKLLLPEYAKVQGEAVGAKPAAVREKTQAVEKKIIAAGDKYVVQPGDSLSKVAARHGVSTKALREANKLKGDTILIGQKLTIPGSKTATTPEAKPEAAAPALPEAPAPEPVVAPMPEAPAPPVAVDPAASLNTAKEQPLEYVVQEGDTVEDIAKLFTVQKEDLLKLNKLDAKTPLKPGKKLTIPSSMP